MGGKQRRGEEGETKREGERRRGRGTRGKERGGEEGEREGRRKLTENGGKCCFLFKCTCTVTDLMYLPIPTSVCT